MRLTLILGRRLLGGAALIAAVLVLNFVLIRLAPGDPALAIAGGMGGATEEMLSARSAGPTASTSRSTVSSSSTWNGRCRAISATRCSSTRR